MGKFCAANPLVKDVCNNGVVIHMVRKILALGMLVGLMGSLGCSYGGIAVAQNGTVYVARNDSFLFGALRGVYACTPAGAELNCTKAGSP